MRKPRGATIAAIVAALCLCGAGASAAPTHPLDPLDAAELITIRDILAGSDRFSTDTNFAWIALEEPPKLEVHAFGPGGAFTRRAAIDAIDYEKGRTTRVIVDLKAARIASLTDLGTRQPGLTDRDSARARLIVDTDPRIKNALIGRGLRIPGRVSDSVHLQYMAAGTDPSLEQENGRLMRVLFGADQDAVSNLSPFVDGLMVVVDLYAKRVVKLHDVAGVPSAPVPLDIFDPKVRGNATPARPVVATQPEGRNFVIEGATMAWRDWRLRYSFNPREGLVLHQVAFNDGSRSRPILYRAALAEVLTSYGDPDPLWSWMQIFDEGAFGLGYLSAAIEPGRHVPANAITINALAPDASQPRFGDMLNDRIYVYERDGGNLVYQQQGSRSVHVRATELVVGFIASLGNYAFGFNWVFREDGSFAFEVELSGGVSTKFVRDQNCGSCAAITSGPGPNGESRTYESSAGDRYGGLVHRNVVGLNHQHWFNLRLDFDIDGAANAVVENNVRRPARTGEATADEPAFTIARTVFGRAIEAKRTINHDTSRTWTVYNPSAGHGRDRAPGYQIVPMENTATTFPRTRQRDPAAFTHQHLWVTPFRDGQFYAAGAYPNQAKSSYADTLYAYADESLIYDKDIVVWYSLGSTHVPRPEDFPLMSSKRLSVAFHPDGFFERNPLFGRPETPP